LAIVISPFKNLFLTFLKRLHQPSCIRNTAEIKWLPPTSFHLTQGSFSHPCGAEIVITGSFPFTKAAEEQNADNLLIIRNRAVAETYIKNYLEHSRHSEPYEAKTKSNLGF